MGTDLFAVRKKDNLDTNEVNYIVIGYYQIWSDWRDFHWPESLQHFWWKFYDYDSAQYYAKTIRKHYPSDIELLRFVNWLETFDKDIIFQLSI